MASLAVAAAGRAARAAPLSVFLLLYLLTCWIGGMALLLGPDWVRDWYVYNSGLRLRRLDPGDVREALLLLNVAPLLLVAGWWSAGRLTDRFPSRPATHNVNGVSSRGVGIALAVVAGYLIVRLAAVGSISSLDAWFEYDAFIAARREVMDSLSFADFVLAYSVAPLLGGGYLALSIGRGLEGRPLAVRIVIVVATLLLLSGLLFQKRPFFVALLMASAAVLAYPPARERIRETTSKRVLIITALLVVCAGGIYVVSLTAPVLRATFRADLIQSEPLSVSTFDDRDSVAEWTSVGPFTQDGARLFTAGGFSGRGLGLSTDAPHQGAAVNVPVAGTPQSSWHASARARSERGGPVTMVVGGSTADYAERTVFVGPEWRPIDVDWLQRLPSDRVNVAIRTDDPSRVMLDDVALYRTFAAPGDGSAGVRVYLRSTLDEGTDGWRPAGGIGQASLSPVDGYRSEGALRVVTADQDAGVQRSLPDRLPPGRTVVAEGWVRGDEPMSLMASFTGQGVGAAQELSVTDDWQQFAIKWTTPNAQPRVRFALLAEQPAAFEVDDVVVSRPAPAVSTKAPVAATPAPPAEGVTFPRLEEIGTRTPLETLAGYVLLAPFVRTSGPAVVYPAIYPRRHPYYPIDLGLDVIGVVHSAPDDNRTSFEAMFPQVGDGQNAVPFAFTFFSQGGLVVALAGALLLGFAWRVAWWLVGARIDDAVVAAVLAALLVTFGGLIAGDSARNALLVSYGIVWPGLLLGGWIAARAAYRRLRPAS